MPKETFTYSNDDVTVVWKPNTCIHSTLCWKGLIDVFNPKEKPWVKMNGAATHQIIEQVRQCPSGALSYYLNAAVVKNETDDAVVAEAATMTKVEVTPNGPYVIQSECLIIHSNGHKETKTGTIVLCRCGASQNKPYCDGGHHKIGFEG